MSRLKFLVVGFVLSSAIHAQDRSEIWLSAGVKSPVGKHLVASIGTNARVRFDGK